MKSKGMLEMEGHIENPHESTLFSQYPAFIKNHHAVDFLCDNLRVMTMGVEDHYQIEEMMDHDLESHHHELERISGAVLSRNWTSIPHVTNFDEADVTDVRQGRALDRFRGFLAASGLPRAARADVAAALVANHDWTYAIVAEAAAAGHAGFADHWRAVAPAAGRARRWCERNRRALLAAAR